MTSGPTPSRYNLYVAVSRARHRLYVFCKEGVSADVLTMRTAGPAYRETTTGFQG